jgi:DNA-directed RNA polymerase specialized sigma24 family protein/AmiR/NasT family two-component response regulator
MSVSAAITPHIPFLRRFARALTGTQQSGDAYVAATLEAILVDQNLFKTDLSPRVALYRIFLRTWQSIPTNLVVDKTLAGAEAAATRNLGAIPVAPRIAFLLNAVESFTIGEIAQTLDCTEAEARDLIDQAGRGIAAQISTKVLIIEDEPLIALDLQYLVEQLGHEVTTIARTHTEAVRAALKGNPGLILADIQLADGSSGLEAVNEILGSIEAPVIFITAFPERFLTGQAPEPAFLIAKPFSAESVKAVISQALFFERKSQRIEVNLANR